MKIWVCYGIITSRNTCKIKDFECFGEHCIINLGLRPAALPRIAPGAMKLWYNSRKATIINFMARTIRSRSSLPSQWPIIPFRHCHHGIITSPVSEIEDFERVPENIVTRLRLVIITSPVSEIEDFGGMLPPSIRDSQVVQDFQVRSPRDAFIFYIMYLVGLKPKNR